MRSIKVSTLALLIVLGLHAFAHDTATGMHISTKSPQAHVFFEKAMQKMEMLHTQDGLDNFRNAVKADPQFALGHIFLTFFSQDPTEQVAEREKALATRASTAERPARRPRALPPGRKKNWSSTGWPMQARPTGSRRSRP